MRTTKFKEFVPKRLRKLVFSLFICAKTLIGVMAFKAIETALHTQGHCEGFTCAFPEWSIAGAVTVSILLPIFGLEAITEELE